MKDYQLVTRLDEIYLGIKEIYRKCSGFIHFSEISFYQTVTEANMENINLSVGGDLPERYNDTLVSIAHTYCRFYEILTDLLIPVAECKEELDNKKIRLNV